ncbi:hypothetical protein L2735_17365 [Shewanella olleyana]|uniref:hypothetical protein n=1 Tax=Shewanella olleyana TaxID=135626 RepID=UPI00200F743C|nr:hypothetical protein [Shewanella olleyana]MCL1068544.1 hypothetical protein [Shewanella olleyana]
MSKTKILQFVLAVLSITGWGLAVYALIVFGEARPDRAVGYYLSKGVEVRFDWDPDLTIKLEYLIWWCAGISFVNLAVNYYAKTARKVEYWINIPLLLLVSLAAGFYIRYVV